MALKEIPRSELKVGDEFWFRPNPGNEAELTVVHVDSDYLVARFFDGSPALIFTAPEYGSSAYIHAPEPELQFIDWTQVKAGAAVMVRDDDSRAWCPTHFSVYAPQRPKHFLTGGIHWAQCKLAPTDWLVWQGGDQPVPDGVMVDLWYRGSLGSHAASISAGQPRWRWLGHPCDIIHYRITGELAPGYRWY